MTQKIDSKDLDVIVIGAGPAGGSCARECAKRGLKVLLIERSQEIGEPNYSTAGTPKETIEMFSIPDSVLSATWNRILLATPRVTAVWEYPEVMGYVFDFAALRKFLVEDAAKNGAEVMIGTTVKEFLLEEGHVRGVRYHGVLGEGDVRARVVVDATGHSELANATLKLNEIRQQDLVEAMELQMTGLPKKLHNTLATFLSSRYAPHGYAWIFPMNNNQDAKVGICGYGPVTERKSLKELEEVFMSRLPYFDNMEPTEIHAGAAHIDGGVKHHVHQNVILIGDAARQINPLAGEGVRHALHAGRLAAEAIVQSLQNGVLDEKKLKREYERSWKKEFGTKWRLSYLLANIIYRLEDNVMGEFLKAAQTIAPQDIFDILFHFEYAKFMKYPKVMSFFLKSGKNFLLHLR